MNPGSIFRSPRALLWCVFAFSLLCSTTGLATPTEPMHQPEQPLAGSIEAELDGRRVTLAGLTSDYRIRISGDIAAVTLKQTFSNPYDKPLNARYLFPLNRHAAVHAMTLHIGNEIISAQIEEIQQAQQTFTKAKKEGKAASLLEAHRPNLFTQRIANLLPELPIQVEIEYTQVVPKIDGAYELVVPMVVGPRFQPPGAETAWTLERLPAYPPAAGVHVPESVVDPRVSLLIDLEAPVPIGAVYSDTHRLDIEHRSSTQQTIRLADNKVPDNRDFVLRYFLGSEVTASGLLSHWQAGEGGYFSLLIEPPTSVDEAAAIPREMVFLLDCSGSMNGLPMAASKRFMAAALGALRPTDSFRIIRFSDSATEFSSAPLPATPFNIERGLRYTEHLYGSGGTLMTLGIEQALDAPLVPGTVRNVVFLTDGYIGNELSVLSLVHRMLGDARLFAFGVGAGVNRYLLDELGRTGRGFTRYFDPTRDDESQTAVVQELVTRLQTPILTDIEIDWGGLPVTGVVPETLPDLYAGDSLRVTGRYTKPAAGTVTIRANSRGHAARIETPVVLDETADHPAIRRIWARNSIGELMHAFITPTELRPDGMDNAQLQAGVTDLGLTYEIATRWTAFVAVSRKVYNPDPAAGTDADVALPKVAGVSALAYAPPALSGGGAPEPGALLALLVGLGTWGLWRRSGSRSATGSASRE